MTQRIAAILAGGKSSRMGGCDKALIVFDGQRLIDRIIAGLTSQADLIVISGRENYGTGLIAIPDDPMAAEGPAAGVLSVARWLAERVGAPSGFFTAPVDAPVIPNDLIARLGETGSPTVAADDDGVHPTFAFWTLAALRRAESALRTRKSISLHALAGACAASEAYWRGANCFPNINTPEELVAAARADG